jgi:hypothetical protein
MKANTSDRKYDSDDKIVDHDRGRILDNIIRLQRMLTVVILSWASGCATLPPLSEPTTAEKVATAPPDVQCHSERLTGSLIASRVCTSKAQRSATELNTQSSRDALNRAPAPACPGTPGC